MEHAFTQTIRAVLQRHFGAKADEVYQLSSKHDMVGSNSNRIFRFLE
jgi:hypothetical protein